MQQQPFVDLKPYFRTLKDLGEPPLDWSEFFDRDQPVELDIGCGRGLFLVRAGLERPDVNFLGIEIDYREGRRAASKLQKRRMSNVRVLGGDAKEFLRRWLPPQSVRAAHVYFPDPWWKKKHKKRRLFNDDFVHLLAKVVQYGGEVHSWTDVGEYFEVISALMDHHPCFERVPPPPERLPEHDLDYQTSFERKKRKAGCTIHRGRWLRNDRPAPKPLVAVLHEVPSQPSS